jgi:hypothetical protein
MTAQQYELPVCLAPCWPIECKCCPYGDENTTLEEVEAVMEAMR